jgi:hypothetical protein
MTSNISGGYGHLGWSRQIFDDAANPAADVFDQELHCAATPMESGGS